MMIKKLGFIVLILAVLVFLQPTLFKGLLASNDASEEDLETRGLEKATQYAEGYEEEDFGAAYAAPNEGMFPVEEISQPIGPWKDLLELKFAIKFDEAVDDVLFQPKFTKKIKAYENRVIEVEGFIIPSDIAADAMGDLDDDGQKFMFSAFPLASCFFCGGAGAESVMEAFPKKPIPYTEKKVTIRGRLELNDEDYLQLPYILKDVVLVEEKL